MGQTCEIYNTVLYNYREKSTQQKFLLSLSVVINQFIHGSIDILMKVE